MARRCCERCASLQLQCHRCPASGVNVDRPEAPCTKWMGPNVPSAHAFLLPHAKTQRSLTTPPQARRCACRAADQAPGESVRLVARSVAAAAESAAVKLSVATWCAANPPHAALDRAAPTWHERPTRLPLTTLPPRRRRSKGAPLQSSRAKLPPWRRRSHRRVRQRQATRSPRVPSKRPRPICTAAAAMAAAARGGRTFAATRRATALCSRRHASQT